ncbi:ead/Ea22-like family protein [Salmonella enterica subsp. enterica]
MNDITRLVKSMREAAEQATAGPWFVSEQGNNWNIDDGLGGDIALAKQRTPFATNPGQFDRTANAKFIAQANPANVLALVEALEKREELRASANRVVNQQDIEIQELRQHLHIVEVALSKAQRKADIFDLFPEDYVITNGPMELIEKQAMRIAQLERANAAQSSLVVPDEMPLPKGSEKNAIDAVAEISKVLGWNACRAAMIQGKANNLPGGKTGNSFTNAELEMMAHGDNSKEAPCTR